MSESPASSASKPPSSTTTTTTINISSRNRRRQQKATKLPASRHTNSASPESSSFEPAAAAPSPPLLGSNANSNLSSSSSSGLASPSSSSSSSSGGADTSESRRDQATVSDDESEQRSGCRQSPSHLLGALGPRMQTLLHKTIGHHQSQAAAGAPNSKTHRRLKSELDFSWLPASSETSDCSALSGGGGGHLASQLKQSQSLLQLRPGRREEPSGRRATAAAPVRMKLFNQRLDKLFDQRLLKQWASAVRAGSNYATAAASMDGQLSAARRRQLELEAIPEPIRNLLAEISARGPQTEGIFRKSPSAKHCKQLRQKLESDSRSSIEDFQVTVIASVFKEWLRSLPDCLLMSRLYAQWIDVAKLIEPLQQQPKQQQQEQQQQQLAAHLPSCNQHGHLQRQTQQQSQQELQQQQQQLGRHLCERLAAADDDERDNGDGDDDPRADKADKSELRALDSSLRPSTWSSLAVDGASRAALDRTRSCSDALAGQQVPAAANSGPIARQRQPENHGQRRTWRSLASFKLSERRSECLRFVRQLLDNLADANLLLLRAFVAVLCRIANSSELNKMSASNLGVCVGQSLLNDEQQAGGSSSKAAKYNLSRRLRRTRSYSLLSSTFSHSSPSLNKIDTAQEAAKYVPVLVTFMIENARHLFGATLVDLFAAAPAEQPGSGADLAAGCNIATRKSQIRLSLDVGRRALSCSTDDDHDEEEQPMESHSENTFDSSSSQPRHLLVVNNRPVTLHSTTTTTIGADSCGRDEPDNSSSGANSAFSCGSTTSGLHSESPAFSSELDSQHTGSSGSSGRLSDSPRSSVSSSASGSPLPSSEGASPIPQKQQHNNTIHSSHADLSQERAQSPASKQRQPFEASERLFLPGGYHTLASSTPKSRHRNSLPPDGFSSFMGCSMLKRAPKLPVKMATSSYGGQAIIYNPRPTAAGEDESAGGQICVVCPHDSRRPVSISVRPLEDSPEVTGVGQQRRPPTTTTAARDELQQRPSAADCGHQQPRPLAAAPATRRRDDGQALAAARASLHAQPELNYLAPIFAQAANLNSLHHLAQQQQQALHQQLGGGFSSLVSCPQHRQSLQLEPARSHVMSLRDYYLSLQQRQQQQQNSYTLHRHLQLLRAHQPAPAAAAASAASNEPQFNSQQQHHRPSQQQQQLRDHKNHQAMLAQGAIDAMRRQQQHYKLVESSSHFQLAPDSLRPHPQHPQLAGLGVVECRRLAAASGQQHHQHQPLSSAAIHRPQTKVARIRQNQFASSAGGLLVAAKSKLMSSGSDNSSGNSSDGSDEFANDWTESTMV